MDNREFPLDISITVRYTSILGYYCSLDLTKCCKIAGVSPLRNGVSHYEITDVSAMGGVRTLDLSFCCRITDVSMLGYVQTLNLKGCTGVTDFNALGYVHSIGFSFCDGITGVSPLLKLYALDLSFCQNLTHFSALVNVIF